jgi:hypothetical protein
LANLPIFVKRKILPFLPLGLPSHIMKMGGHYYGSIQPFYRSKILLEMASSLIIIFA